MATGLPLPLYTLPTSAMDLRYKSPYLNDAAIVPYVTSGSPFPTCAMNVNSMTLSQWNYYNSLVASAASQNFMATMLRMSSNSTRLSPQSRDSGISSDPAVSPQGSLDLSLTPNRNKGINQKMTPGKCFLNIIFNICKAFRKQRYLRTTCSTAGLNMNFTCPYLIARCMLVWRVQSLTNA